MSIKNTSPFAPRFIFHGNAVAADVFLTKVNGVTQTIYHPIDGQSCLPVIGGRSHNKVTGPVFEKPLSEVFHYAASRTSAEGIFEGDNAMTTVHASVDDVRITNREKDGAPDVVFTAGEIALTIRSVHAPSGQPRFEFIETPKFQNLSFNGLPIELELNEELMGLKRWDDLDEKYASDRAFLDGCSFGPLPPRESSRGESRIPRAAGSFALCSLVKNIILGGRVIRGHVLEHAGFGAIYFGEMLLNDRERRVTMVRTQLGCHSAGQSVHGETDPNGSTWPPPPPPPQSKKS